ncbi:MAG TPA: hypothetical protein PKE63_04120 [Lacibacter sp.]|nr:hypothetical protein [Lacibacter sp.]HMO89027.1 hypothetical protein [Lacibacter sp.]HMP86436.1 hypothetical protein [Lacibacter sp.]
MDQRHSHTGTLITAVLLLIVGLVLLPVVLGMLLSYPSPVFYGGLLLGAGTFLILRSAVQGIGHARRDIKESAQTHAQILQKAAEGEKNFPAQKAPVTDFNEHQLLAKWEIPSTEWTAFCSTEQRRRISTLWMECILIVVLGTLLLRQYRDGSWQMGLLVSSLLAGIWAAGKYLLHLRPLRRMSVPVQLLLTPSTVYINGRPNVFYDAVKRPSRFRLLEEERPAVLEITYMWPTRRGTTFEELRVPVPAGREAEARQWVEQLTSFL